MSDLIAFPPQKHNLKAISIHTVYADKIRDGSKTVELRTYSPGLLPGDWCLLYETKPAQHISTAIRSAGFWCLDPAIAWDEHKHIMGINKEDYFKYFQDRSCAYGTLIDKIVTFDPIPYEQLSSDVRFTYPQGVQRWRSNSIYSRILHAIGVNP